MKSNELSNSVSENKRGILDGNIIKFIKYVKEYLSVIIFVPTVLGGMWQLIVLWSFGLPYIRFFSITQLVADGLIMLLFVPLVVVVTYLVFMIPSKLNLDYKNNRASNGLLYTFYIFLLYGYFIWRVIFSDTLIENFNLLDFLLSSVILVLTLILAEYVANYYYRVEIVLRHKANKKAFRDRIFKFDKKATAKYLVSVYFSIGTLIVFMFSIFLFIIMAFIIFFNISNYYKPTNMVNAETVLKFVEDDYSFDREDFEISYYNDSYIFIKHFTVNKQVRDSLLDNRGTRHYKEPPFEFIILKSDKFFE